MPKSRLPNIIGANRAAQNNLIYKKCIALHPIWRTNKKRPPKGGLFNIF
ncbi:Hypothetical protein I595_166 [Croceitalea dokdonensis DOKDO 023]|uniref:Uncharacterized protein n=1 Tax=Croceitalea dokdonensis DOKDO 023 TaxID=1300341 RepID=A0A0P7AYE4_9FLAO|nr:Hypothetical protein I595_166 [Croceitalea dokdonensis DOKDO 023]